MTDAAISIMQMRVHDEEHFSLLASATRQQCSAVIDCTAAHEAGSGLWVRT